jgi:hypothetical protein
VLDDVPTEGLTYDDRDVVAGRVYEAMRGAQRETFGIESPPWNPRLAKSTTGSQAVIAGGP